MTDYTWIDSPLGRLCLTADGDALTGLYLEGQKHFPQQMGPWQKTDRLALFTHVQEQLADYFAHRRQTFEIPLNPLGTHFQTQVWQQLTQIPFGTTLTYGALAQRIGNPAASRAVGAANGRNPIAIIVPCHRVIATNGTLTGYAGGLDRKRWLLRHEGANCSR